MFAQTMFQTIVVCAGAVGTAAAALAYFRRVRLERRCWRSRRALPRPPGPAPADAVTMEGNLFHPADREVAVGGTLTISNTSSRALHVLAVGTDAETRVEHGAPSFGRSGHRSEVGGSWTTPAGTTPGVYHITCTIHPAMNMRVTVVGP